MQNKETMVSQCPHCRSIKVEDGSGRTKSVPSIGEFPSLQKTPCHVCIMKNKEIPVPKPDIKKVDVPKMKEVTEKAVERSYDNADTEWRSMVLDCVKIVCERSETFTVNEVRELVNASPLKTHDNRAMGGVMATAKKLKWLAPTGQSIPSVVGHKVHIQIWKSLIFKS